MKPSRTTQYKALFLLVSFSLNIVVGFACSLGLDMGFNAHHHNHHDHHHHDKEKHAHEHPVKDHGEADENHHHHHHAAGHVHARKSSNTFATFTAAENDNCCNSLVVSFQSLDKQLAQKDVSAAKSIVAHTFFILPEAPFLKKNRHYEPIKTPPKIHGYSPPDIRVLIQSFQI